MENKNWDESIANILTEETFNQFWDDIKKQDMTPKMRAATFLLLGYLSAKEEQKQGVVNEGSEKQPIKKDIEQPITA